MKAIQWYFHCTKLSYQSALGMKPYSFVVKYKRNVMQWFGFELIYLNIYLHAWKRTSAPKQLSWTWQHLNDFVKSIGWLAPRAESSTFMFELLQTMQLKCFFLQAGFPCLIRDFHKNNRDWWYSGCFQAAITKDVGSRLKAKLNYPNHLVQNYSKSETTWYRLLLELSATACTRLYCFMSSGAAIRGKNYLYIFQICYKNWLSLWFVNFKDM